MSLRADRSQSNLFCPFTKALCSPDCMLFLTRVPAGVVCDEMLEGEGHCSISVLAGHIANESHIGGNYLGNTLGYRYREDGDEG